MTSNLDLNDLLSILEGLEGDTNTIKTSTSDENSEKKQDKWKLDLSPDLLTATLHVRPTDSGTTITSRQLMDEIKKRHISYGIDWCACASVENIKKETEITVAQGTPCVPSVDADIKVFFSTQSRELISVGEEEKIDFKNRYKFTCVKPGELLAEKIPPIYGKPGINIKGEIISPKPPKDIELVAGSGTKINSKKNQIFSTIHGRPMIQQCKNKALIEVIPSLKHEGNVDMSTGNIQFTGDIIISGSVKDGMMVKSNGQIIVGQIVSNANLQASEGIKIYGNVISSYIAADSIFSSADMSKTIGKIQNKLEKLILLIKRIMNKASLKKTDLFGPLYKALIDKKFKDLPTIVTEFYQNVQQIPQNMSPLGLLDFSKELMHHVVNYPLTIKDMKQLEGLYKKVCNWQENFKTCLNKKSNIILKYAQNTQIQAPGDVIVFGDGCYNSSIQSGGNVNISGVFRGGKIKAQKNVFISEAGSQVGTRTDIYVQPNSQIVLAKVFYNTVVHFGKFVYKFEYSDKKVKIRLHKGELIVSHCL